MPRYDEILALWEDTLLKLRDGDFVALSRRLDWVLKLQILRRAMTQREPTADELAAMAYADGALRVSAWVHGRKGVFTMDQFSEETLDPLFKEVKP